MVALLQLQLGKQSPALSSPCWAQPRFFGTDPLKEEKGGGEEGRAGWGAALATSEAVAQILLARSAMFTERGL